MNTIIVIGIAIVAVAALVAGLSLTLIVKGHHIDSEISTNRHMKARGITCAVKDATPADCTQPSIACEGASCESCL